MIGREAKYIWENYHWINESDRYAIQPVLQMYTDYCTPKVNVPFERHMFHSRKQQPNEDVMAWYSQMRKIGANCAFDEITSDEIYRDHLVSSVYKDSVREKLLERRELTLETALDIIRNSEIKIEHAKAWNNVDDTDICNSVNRHNDKQSAKKRFEKANENADFVNDCSYCGMRHAKKASALPGEKHAGFVRA